MDLAQHVGGGDHVLEDLRGQHRLEAAVAEGKGGRLSTDVGPPSPRVDVVADVAPGMDEDALVAAVAAAHVEQAAAGQGGGGGEVGGEGLGGQVVAGPHRPRGLRAPPQVRVARATHPPLFRSRASGRK